MPRKSKNENTAVIEKGRDYGAEVKMLTAQKEQRTSELAEKEAELDRLEKELGEMQDSSYQAKMIEATLAARYAEANKQYPIDREQEPEIRETIKEKSKKIKIVDEALKRHKKYPWLAPGREEKKNYLDGLKRTFGELEVDIKRFHKKGISKEYLLELIALAQAICDQGSKFGTIPASYHQKIYKWTQMAKEIPVDLKKEDREKEAAAKKRLENMLAEKKKTIKSAEQEIATLEQLMISCEKEAERLKAKLAKAEAEYPQEKQRIEDQEKEERSKINQISQELEEIKSAKKAVEDDIASGRARIAQYHDEKQRLQIELDRTFALAVGKKKELREKIAALDLSAQEQQGSISQQLQRQKALEYSETNAKARLKDIILHEDDAAKKVASLDKKVKELRKELFAQEEAIPRFQAEIKRYQKTIKTTEEELPELEKAVKDFHTDYLIKTYSKEMKIADKVKDIRAQTAATKLAIKKLKQESKEIDGELAKAIKEDVSRQETLRQEQVEKAMEEQRIKKEQEERQERIQNELLAREKEQEAIAAQAISLAHIGTVIQEIENDPNHPLLQEKARPLSDDGKRVITNSIVRKRYRQEKKTSECSKYLLLFVDQHGNAISEQRLIDQKAVGDTTETSFELKANDGFNAGNYYLLVLNFNTGDILSAERYQINISFANDFDF